LYICGKSQIGLGTPTRAAERLIGMDSNEGGLLELSFHLRGPDKRSIEVMDRNFFTSTPGRVHDLYSDR
jgi:hypothetical protein